MIDPAGRDPLLSLLEGEILSRRNLSAVDEMRDRIEAAADQWIRQAAADENLPWVYYDLGTFRLLTGLPYEALDAYSKAVDVSTAAFMIETALAYLRRLSEAAELVPGDSWSRDLLALALRAKFAERTQVGSSDAGPVVVLAGGTSAEEEKTLRTYGPILLQAFRDFEGTLVSGGTVHGVSGFAGDIAERYAANVRTLGYHPRTLPVGAEPDARYDEIHETDSDSFSPLEPLTYWEDLLGGGADASRITLIAIGGGRVAAAEYRIALALGAALGVIDGSGRAADELLSDGHWSRNPRMRPLAPDPEAIRSFLSPG